MISRRTKTETIIKFRYCKLDISGIGPFGPESTLRFNDGLCCISAGNGLGKSTIAQALVGEFPEALVETEGSSKNVPRWSLILDYKNSPLSCTPLELFHQSIKDEILQKTDTESFCELVSGGITQMLALKYSTGNKFTGTPADKFTGTPADKKFEFRIDQSHDHLAHIIIDGENVDYAFQAAGETMVLYLASVAAVRQLTSPVIDTPFIVDGQLGCLDIGLLKGVIDFLESNFGQVILLENTITIEFSKLSPISVIRCGKNKLSYLT